MGLSEPKSRTLYAADPRNLNWSQDRGRFGFRMLEKMGWSEGKGLGANEDGQREHVKIKLKTNVHGVGADKKTIRNWLAHSTGFDELLGRLNAGDSAPTKAEAATKPAEPENEEQKEEEEEAAAPSKPAAIAGRQSHRARFRRMKQMAVQDERGLREILGISAAKTQAAAAATTAPATATEASPPLLQQTETVGAKVSAAEYFARKMADNPALAAICGGSVARASAPESEADSATDGDAAVPDGPPRKKRKERDGSGSGSSSSDDRAEKREKKEKKPKSKSSKAKTTESSKAKGKSKSKSKSKSKHK